MKKYFSLIILVIITFISCEESEINLGESNLIENQTNFQVDFDGQTYHADYVDASIVDGIIMVFKICNLLAPKLLAIFM